MNIEKLNDWIQVAGVFVLAASLVFFGFQLKQDREMDSWAGPISTQEFLLARMQSQSFLVLADNSYFQYDEGFLPEDHWLSVRESLKNTISGVRVLRSLVDIDVTGFRPDFRDKLLKIVAEIDQEK